MGEERLEPATEVLRSAGLSIAVPDVARRLVFVTVLVVVIAQASAVAGLGYFGDLADSIIRTIPAVCIGLAFLLAGIVAGRQAGRLVAAMAARGPVPAGFAGAATQAAIVAAAAVSAVDAMGISTTLPVALIALSVAALFGLAVAAGVLAARGVLAHVASRLVRGGVRRARLDGALADLLGGSEGAAGAERAAGAAAFWIGMLLVAVAALEALALDQVSEPLNESLNEIFAFLPRAAGAALLLVAAIVVARFLRGLVARALLLADIDRRLGEQAGGEPEVSVSTAVSEASFWLTLLLFLPAILGVLAIDGLTDPVGNMVDRVLVFAPKLVAAAVILGVGVLAARILRRIVANLAQSVGADGVGERVGLTGDNGTQRLSDLLGLVVYALILIPVIVSALNALQIDAVAEPTSNMLDRMLTAVPSVLAASAIIVLAYVAGRIVADLVTGLLAGAGFNALPERLGLRSPDAAGMTPSRMVGSLVFAAIVIAAAMEAVNALGFDRLSDLAGQFVVFGGQILFGLAIVAVGLFVANVAANAVAASAVGRARTIALITRVVIIAFAVALGLQEMGIANEIVMLAFGIPLGALALAAAVAVGVGGRDLAAQELTALRDALRGDSAE